MATTPSGMSIADAEALSKKQQQNILVNLPKDAQFFTSDDEMLAPLQFSSGGKFYQLDPKQVIPEYWQTNEKGESLGRLNYGWNNWGQAMNAYWQRVKDQLGLGYNDIKNYNPADLTGASQNYQEMAGFQNPEKYGIDQFKSLFNVQPTDYNLGAGTPTDPAKFNADYLAKQGGSQVSIAGTQGTGWIDPATGQPTPMGIGIPAPSGTGATGGVPSGATYIDDPAKLKGLTESQIWRDPNSNKIYQLQQATLYNPNTGAKKVVSVGSTEANQLLSQGWSLGDGGTGGDTIGSGTLLNQPEINIGTGTTGGNGSLADQTLGAIGIDIKSTQDLIKYYQDLLNPAESDLSKQVSSLLSEAGDLSGDLTGRGAMQLEEEKKRNIEGLTQQLADKNTELEKKVAEINALTASYNLANQEVEGKPMTLSRLQGAQAQNYKMYIAQKNLLTSEASYIQADLLGLQGKVDAAQAAADRAVQLEFQDRQDAYNAKINLLNILQPQLEKEEAKYAQAVSLALQQQADALAEQKANKKDILNIKLQAISSGITDPSVLNSISQARSLDEAIQILGTNMPAPVVSGGGGGIITTPTAPQQTFEEFIAQKEQQAGMSFANPEQFRGEYEDLIDNQVQQLQDSGTDVVTAYAEMVAKGQANLSSIPNSVRNEVALKVGQLGGANKALSETAIKQIAETQNAIDGLLDLKDKVAANLEYIGPIKGLAKLNPWSKARQIQADVDRIRQKVGKALEGGVLRKEDEEKYKKILATITDTPETANYKIDQLIEDIQTDYNRYLEAQAGGGRYTGGFTEQITNTINNDPLGIF